MRSFALVSLVALTMGASLSAQCLNRDDGLFTGRCCDTVRPSLPAFPEFGSDALWLCIAKCRPELKAKAEFKISRPDFIDCDRVVYEAKFGVDFGLAGSVSWEGKLEGKYSRTFGRVNSLGQRHQVYRFILNGDFIPRFNMRVNECQVPSSYFLFRAVHFVGHIDYACRPTARGFDVAVSLQHLPGCISHGAVSSRPDSGPLSGQEFNYYLVAPGAFNTGAGTGNQPSGRLLGEEMRVSNPAIGRCFSENRLRQPQITDINKDCPCVGGGGSMPWYTQKTELVAFCGNQFTAWEFQVLGPPVVPPGLNLQTVGQWALPAGQYPEREQLIHYQGFVTTNQPVLCNPNSEQKQFLYGVGTKGNRTYSLHNVIGPVAFFDNAIDLVNSVNARTQQFQWGVPASSTIQFGLFVR